MTTTPEVAETSPGRSEDRTAHWGTCENESCMTSMVIYPHPDAGHDLPEDEEDWENGTFWIDCPVCDSKMDWGGTDHPADVVLNYPRAAK